MGWTGSITASSGVGAQTAFTPDTTAEGAYSVSAFTAQKKGVYRFDLKGSGGTNGSAAGGKGGSTVGYLLLEKNQAVYVGAGGTCSAAFVSVGYGANLAAAGTPLFIAGAGGAGGHIKRGSADDIYAYAGGNGGGSSGLMAPEGAAGGGTQNSGGAAYVSTSSKVGNGANGAYGTGGAGGGRGYSNGYAYGGRGGDGYYGGAGGFAQYHDNDTTGDWGLSAYGGGGGSGYIHPSYQQVTVLSNTFTASTNQGGGAAAGGRGSVTVTYAARTVLPVFFDGTQLERLFFNGTEAEHLTLNGVPVYMRRWAVCLRSAAERFVSRAGTRGSSPSASRA